MTQIPKISLNEKWRYRFGTSNDMFSDPNIDDSSWDCTQFDTIPISKVAPPEVIGLRKRFDLTPTETCIRYFLRCDHNVYPMTIYLRGREVLQTRAHTPIDVDVTDELSLEDNVMVVVIYADRWDLSVQNSELYLQPIFCDDLT